MRRNQSNRRRTQKIFNTIARNKGVLAVSAAAAAVCSSQYAQGSTDYLWNLNGGGNFVPTPLLPADNWTPVGYPSTPGDTADFTNVDINTNNSTVTFDIPLVTLGSMVFGNTDASPSVSWLLNPGVRTNAAIVFAQAPAHGTPSINVNNSMSGGLVNLGVALLGTQGLIINGNGSTGTLTLSGNSPNFASPITLNSGTLNINNANALGADVFQINNGVNINNNSGAAISLATNNALNWNGGFTYVGTNPLNLGNGNINLNATSTVNVLANTFVVPGSIQSANTFALLKTGSGTLLLSGANTFNGGIHVGLNDGANAGELSLGSPTALGAGPLTLGATVQGQGYANGVFLDNGSGAALTLTTTGAVNIDQNVTFVGTNPLAFNVGSTINLVPDTLANNPVITVNASTLTFNGPVIDNGFGFTKAGGGTLALTNPNNTIAYLTVQTGTLSFANDGALGAGLHGFLGTEILQLQTGSTLAWGANNTSDITAQVAVQLSGNTTFNIGPNSVSLIAQELDPNLDPGGLTVTGSGTLSLAGESVYTGATTVNANNALILNSSVNFFSMDTGTVTVFGLPNSVLTANGTLGFNTGGTSSTAFNIDGLAGAGALSLATTSGATNPSLVLGGATASQTFSGAISGPGNIVKNGTYTQTLSGSSSSNGGITLNQGTLALGVNAFGTGPLAINGGTLNTSGNTITVVTNNAQSWNGSFNFGNAQFQFGTSIAGTNGVVTLNTAVGGTIGVNVTAGIQTLFDTVTDNGHSEALNLTGSGRLYLQNTGTFSGGVIVNSPAYLGIGNGSALGSGVLTINGGTISNPNVGTTVTLANNQKWAGNFTFDGTAPMIANGAVTLATSPTVTVGTGLTINGVVGDGGSGFGFSKAGGGLLTLTNNNTYLGATTITAGSMNETGSNSYTGGTTINGATLTFSTINSLGHPGTANTIAMNNGTLVWASGNTADISVDSVVLNGSGVNSTFNTNGNNVTFNGPLASGSGGLILVGPGTVTLGAAETSNFLGQFTINGLGGGTGTQVVNWSVVSNFGATGKTIVINSQSSALQWATGNTTDLSASDVIQLPSQGGQFDSNGNNVTWIGAVQATNTGAFTKVGAGTFFFNDTQTVTGAYNINAGAIVLGNSASISTSSAANVNVLNGLQFASGVGTFNTGVLGGSANESLQDASAAAITLNMQNSGSATLTGQLTGPAADVLNMNSTGVWSLNTPGNTANFTGTINLNNGTLAIGGSGGLSGATLNINGGTIDNRGAAGVTVSTTNAQNWNANFAFGGTTLLETTLGAITMGKALTLTTNGTNPLIIGNAIGDGGSGFQLTKAGSGTLKLAGNNTFSGGVNVTGGSVFADNNNAFGNTAGLVTFSSGTTLDSDGGNPTINNSMSWNTALTFGGTNNLTLGIPSTVTMNPAGFPFTLTTNSTGTLTLAGYLNQASGGNVNFVKAGGGNFTLNGTATYGGTTTVSAGVMTLGANNNIPYNNGYGQPLIATGGTLALSNSGVTETVSQLFGTGGYINTGTNSNSQFNITALGSPGVFNGPIVGSGSVVISGTDGQGGTVGLVGANTFSGGLQIDGGVLAIGAANNSLGSGLVYFGGGSIDDPITTTAGITLTGITGQAWAEAFSYLATATASTPLNLGPSPVRVTGDPKITVVNYRLEADGIVSGPGSLDKAGAGTLLLAGNNTFTGSVLVEAGVLNLSGSNAYTGTTTVDSGATLILAGTTHTTGGINLYGGTIGIGSGASLGTANPGSTISFGPTPGSQLYSTTSVSLVGNNPQIWYDSFSLGGTMNLGTGSVTVGGNVVSTVGTSNGTGTVIIGGAINDGANGFAFTKSGSGTLVISGAGSMIGSVIVNGGQLSMTGSNNDFYGSNQSSAGLVVNGGIAALTGANNTFGALSGGVAVYNGELIIGNSTALGAGTSLAVNGGELDNNTGVSVSISGNVTQTWNANFSFGGGDGLPGNNTLNMGTGAVTLAGASRTISTFGTSPSIIGGVISDGGAGYGVTTAGTGVLTFAGNNTYSGPTTVTGGNLQLTGTNTNAGGINVNGGLLTFSNAAANFGTGSVTLGGGGLQWASGTTTDISTLTNLFLSPTATSSLTTGANPSIALSHALGQSNSAGITVIGTGTLSLNGAESGVAGYLGATTIQSSTLTTITGTGTGATTSVSITSPVLVLGNANAQYNGTQGNQIGLNGLPNSLQFLHAAGPNFYVGGLSGTGTESLTDTTGAAINLYVEPSISGNANFSGNLTGSGSVVIGGGTETLLSSNAFTGGFTVSSGRLNINNVNGLGSGALTLTGGTIDNTTTAGLTISGVAQQWNGGFSFGGTKPLTFNSGTATLGANSTITALGTNPLTYNIPINDNGSGWGIGVSGSGIVVLNGTNTYAGVTTVNSGTLTINGATVGQGGFALNGGNLNFATTASLGTAGAANNITFNGGTLTWSSGNTADISVDTVVLTGNAILNPNGNTVVINNPIGGGGSGGLTLGGTSGTLVLAATAINTFTGPITLPTSTFLQFNAAGNISNATGGVVLAGGTLQYGPGVTNDISSFAGGVTLTGRNSTIDTQANNVTFASGIGNGGTGGLIKLGVGTLTFNGSNSYTGATIINTGTLALGNSNALANSSVTVNPTGGLIFTPGVSGAVALGGLNGTATVALSDTSNNPIALTVGSNNASSAFGGLFTGVANGLGTSSLTKNGTGIFTLLGQNSTYAGGTTVNQGILSIASNASIGAPGVANQLNINGATLQYQQSNTDDISLDTVTFGTAGATLDTNGANVVLANSIGNGGGGTIGFTKVGAGVLSLGASNNYTGPTNLVGGELGISTLQSMGTSNVLNFNGGALQWNPGSTADISSGLTVNLNAAAILDTNNNNITFASAFPTLAASTFGLTKTGLGNLTLSATNTYTGPTSINGGGLVLNNSASVVTPGIISTASPLQLGGGTLTVIGNSAGAVTQGFNNTTLNVGLSTLNIPAGSTAIMVNLGTMTHAVNGAILNFNLASDNGATSKFLSPTGYASQYLGNGNNANQGVAYATIGLSDWAAKDASNTFIVGGNQVSGFYTQLGNGTADTINGNFNYDITSSFQTNNTAEQWIGTMRFNTPNTITITTGDNGTYNAIIGVEGVLMTPAVGANNVYIRQTTTTSAGNGYSLESNQSEIVFWQNDTQGSLIVSGLANNNQDQGTNNPTAITKAGPGTMVITGGSSYRLGTFVEGGTLQIGNVNSLSTNSSTITLDGGILASAFNGSLTNGAIHPISVIGVGGGLQANSASTATVDAAMSGSAPLGLYGPGTLIFTTPGSYSGAVTLSNSANVILEPATTGSILTTGSVAIGNNSVLSGSGTLNAGVTVNTGAQVGPGVVNSLTGAGTLVVNNLNLNYGSQTDFNLTGGSGGGSSLINVAHNLNINAPTLVNLWTDNNGSLSFFNVSGTYDLFQVNGAINGNLSNFYVDNIPQGGVVKVNFGTAAGPLNSTFITMTLSGGYLNSNWLPTVGGNLSTTGNWTGGLVPNQPAAFATFGNIASQGTGITAPATITLDTNWSAGSITFANSNAYTLAGSGTTLTMDTGNGAGTATIFDTTGSHFINVPINLNSHLAFTVNLPTNTLTLNGAITGPGKNITLSGSGSLALNTGPNVFNNTTINAHSSMFVNNVGAVDSSIGTGALTLNGALTYNLQNSETLANVMSGTGTLTVNQATGTNTTTFAGTGSSLSGAVTVNTGNVVSNGANALGNNDVANMVNGVYYNLNGYNQTFSAFNNTGAADTIDSTRANSNATLTLNGALSGNGVFTYLSGAAGTTVSTGTNAFTGSITNSGPTSTLSLSLNGGGTTTLAGSNSYSGATFIYGSATQDTVLNITNVNALANTSSITIQSPFGLGLTNGVTLSQPIIVTGNVTNDYFGSFSGVATLTGTLNASGDNPNREGSPNALATIYVTGAQTGSTGNNYFVEGNFIFENSGSFSNTGSPNAIIFGRQTVQTGTYTQYTNVTLENNAQFNVTAGAILGGVTEIASTLNIGVSTADNVLFNASSHNIDMDQATSAANTMTLNLNGGNLIVGGFVKTQTGAGQLGIINFNGGTLTAGQSNGTFLPQLTSNKTYIQPNGLIINPNGHSIVQINANLLTPPTTAGPVLDGGIQIVGPGTVYLGGNETFNGGAAASGYPVSIYAGQLVINNVSQVGGTSASLLNQGTFSDTANNITMGTITPGTAGINTAGVVTMGTMTLGTTGANSTLTVNNITQALVTVGTSGSSLYLANSANLAGMNNPGFFVLQNSATATVTGAITGAGGETDLLAGATLTAGGVTQNNLSIATGAIANLNGPSAIGGQVTNAVGGVLNFGAGATATTIAGYAAGSTGITTLAGGANVTVNGAFTETSLFNTGTLTLNGAVSITNTIDSEGVTNFGSASTTVPGITGLGTTNNGTGSLTVIGSFAQGNLGNNGTLTIGNSPAVTGNVSGTGTINLNDTTPFTVGGNLAQGNLNIPAGGSASVGGVAAIGHTLSIGSGAVATLNGTGGTNTVGYLSAASGTLVLGASVTAQLSQSVGGPPSVTHSVGTLTLGAGSSLDITNNTLLLNETNNSLSQVTTWVQNAATPGATAITSSLVYGPNSQASRTLGYGDSNADPLTVPAGYAEVKYTAVGDTNLDGVVDIVDLGRAINNLGQNAGYSGGDIANQGIVNIVDVADIINDLGGHLSPSTGLSASGVTGSGGSKAAVGFGGGGSAVSAAVLPSGGSRSSASPVVGTAAAKAVSHSGGSIGGSGAAVPDGTVTFVVSVNDDGFGDYTPNAFAIYAIDGTVSGTTVTHNSITANSGGIDGGISNVHVVLAGATPGSLRDDIYSGTTYTTHSGTGKGQLRSSSYYQLTDSATQSNGPSAVEAGFTYSSLHSDNSNTLVAAGQDTVGTPPSLNNVNGQNPSTLIIFGLGQSAGNMQTFANSTTGNNPGIPSGTQLSGSSPSTAPYVGPGTFTYGGNTYLSSLLVADGKYVTGTPPTINTATSTAGLLAAYDEAYSATAGGFVGAGSSTVVAVVTQTLSSSVPEPASLGLLTVGAMGLLARRRRRHAPAKES